MPVNNLIELVAIVGYLDCLNDGDNLEKNQIRAECATLLSKGYKFLLCLSMKGDVDGSSGSFDEDREGPLTAQLETPFFFFFLADETQNLTVP